MDGFQRAILAAGLVFTLSASIASAEDLAMDFKRQALDLSGEWQRLIDHGDANAWERATADGIAGWQAVEVPGQLVTDIRPKDQTGIKCVWARREFSVDKTQASRQGVLKWNEIRFGATIWINEKQVAECPLVGPGTCVLPAGLLKEGVNRIVVRAVGWGGVPRGKSGFPLIPAGASNTQDWGAKAASIERDIWIEFYDRVYMTSILAIPRFADGKATLRTWFDSSEALPANVELRAEVVPFGKPGAKAAVAKLDVKPEKGKPVDLDVRIEDPLPWTPEAPNLYAVKMTALADGKVCDETEFRFGMRELAIEEGRYRLNGKPLWLRGSNLVGEWNWGRSQAAHPKRYLVDEARLMNLNCFRTHAGPPDTTWSGIADEHGMMFLAEMPVLFNTFDFKFTRDEWDVWHANVLRTSEAWIRKLWNHPSVVAWVLSNESGHGGWEAGECFRYVKSLDPTRSALRAGGGGTPDTVDIHTCSNIRSGADGWVILMLARQIARRDPKRTFGNSEYMNDGATNNSLRWFGSPGLREPSERMYAQLGAEHTEAMRRLGYDLILPYMYAGWTSFTAAPGGRTWRDPYPTPMAAGLHSSMAPVLASLDLFDPDYVAGTEVETPLVLINELHADVDAQIDLYVARQDPLFLPDAQAVKTSDSHSTVRRTLKADSMTVEKVRWKVPAETGSWWLAAVLTRKGDRPVVSQRQVRAIADPAPASRLKGLKLVVLGAEPAALKWFQMNGAEASTGVHKDAAVVVVWDAAKVTDEQRKSAPEILERVRAGGRLVVLDQGGWNWSGLIDMKVARFFDIELIGTSHVFPTKDMEKHPLLSGVSPASLHRWNGLPGALAETYVATPAPKNASPILWAEDPEKIVALEIPEGKGTILICQLQTRKRIEGKDYDPAAVQILLNLLAPTDAR